MYQHIKVPTSGQKIKVNPDFSPVPDQPIIPSSKATAPDRHHASNDQVVVPPWPSYGEASRSTG